MKDLYSQITAALEGSKNVLVTTHVRPDGDALGSLSAMVLALRAKGVACNSLLLSHWPTKYAFLKDELGIPYFDAEKAWPADLDLSSYDTLLVVDTGTWSQLPGLKEKLEGFAGRKIVIDHHLTQESWADLRLVVKDAAAAVEIVAELIETWGLKFDKAIATALFVAVTTDTGWFQFSNTRPYTLRLGALLLEAGVDMDAIYKRLYQAERQERVRLQTRAMQSLELLDEGRLAVMTLRKKDFAESQANVPDTENLINVPMQIGSVEVSVLVTEPIDFGPVRVSLRSKGKVNVSKFAEQFGGGGHARAAGLKFEQLTVEDAHDRVLRAMLETMKAAS
jgi:phosphoesterase RecJ-like protein